jgi:DUF1680 family protein
MSKRPKLMAVLIPCLTLLLGVGEPSWAGEESWRDQGVINLSNSPAAKLQTVPIRAVKIQDGFWGERRKVAVEKSIPSIRKLLEAHGYVDNFRRLTEKMDVPRKGPVFADTDTYKWLEAVAYFLESGDHPDLRAVADEYIDTIVKVQEPDGYLNTYFVGDKAKDRLTPESMDWGHELYSLGHMLQAAVAYYRATGHRKLLDARIKYADYLSENFGLDKKPLLAGHPEIEMALVELYRTTGNRRYLDLAGYILHGDPRIVREPPRVIYTFSGIPFTSRTKLEGHAVRAMYACSGATDYYLETGDAQYRQTLETLWQDLVSTKMYITGGLGSRWQGESIGDAYELPNSRAYAETCAAIGNYMWNWRMLAATGREQYTDVLERALYNGVNVGMSLDGTLYCYANPLEYSGTSEPNRHSREGHVRNPWYDVLCCPPNIERTLGSLPGYFYSTSRDGIYVHLFDNSVLNWHLEDGTNLKITQKTRYPWEGTVDFAVDPVKPTEFTFYLRIPGWSRDTKVRVNGEPINSGVKAGEYLPLRRRWQAGDQVQLALDMTPRLMVSSPRLEENVGRIALQRGPVVYCLEKLDQASVQALSNVALVIKEDSPAGFSSEFRPDLLGGVVVVHHSGIESRGAGGRELLYHPVEDRAELTTQPMGLTFIPYYAWANRTPSAMKVWVPYTNE